MSAYVNCGADCHRDGDGLRCSCGECQENCACALGPDVARCPYAEPIMPPLWPHWLGRPRHTPTVGECVTAWALPGVSRLVPERALRWLHGRVPYQRKPCDGWTYWMDASYARYVRRDRRRCRSGT